MGGDIGKYTPPRVSTSEPPSSEGTGESGRVWEKEVFGFLPEAYYEEKNPPEQEQAGAIFCQLGKNKARLMDPAWMMNILKFRTYPALLSWHFCQRRVAYGSQAWSSLGEQ